MAMDLVHRLVVTGPLEAVADLSRRLVRRAVRKSGRLTWRERIPFSFRRLYQLAPAAKRIDPNVPYEAYDVSDWPLLELSGGRAEVRYQFNTRNLELFDFVRALAAQFETVTFYLLTHCLDDGEVVTCRVRGGTARRWLLPGTREDSHWNSARRKFRLSGEDLYENDEARFFAEERMRKEALEHWVTVRGPGRLEDMDREWWDSPSCRDIETERSVAVAARLSASRTGRRRGATSAPRPARRWPIRCARSTACASTAGFHQGSRMKT